MKWLLICAVALAVQSPSFAEQPTTGPATIIDTADVTTELSALSFERYPTVGGSGNVLDSLYGTELDSLLIVTTKNFQFAIPFVNIKAIQKRDDLFETTSAPDENGDLKPLKTKVEGSEITYAWDGKERSVIGNIDLVVFSGWTEFGDARIESDKVKTLRLATHSLAIPAGLRQAIAEDKHNVKAKLMLNDGTAILAGHLLRTSKDSYGQTSFKLDFGFRRGEVDVVADFGRLKTIEFKEGGVVVTLKTGTATTGKPNSGPAALDLFGQANANADLFTGVSENGPFSISSKFLKQIVFEPAEGGKPSLRPAGN